MREKLASRIWKNTEHAAAQIIITEPTS